MRHDIRSKITGRYIPRPQVNNVKAGSLYGWRGGVVRAGRDRMFSPQGTPMRHVSFHKTLFGYVPENELQWIGRQEVDTYLQKAGC